MQRIFNYGSSLQAYALRRLIEEIQPTAHVSYLDYQAGPTLLLSKSRGSEAQGRVGRAFAKIREYSDVEAGARDKLRFFNHKRRYADKYLPAIGVSNERNRDLDLDLQVIGSDEVFNCVQANTNVGYSRDLFGHGSPARHVISYAGSFGNTTLEKIEDAGIRRELADDFRRFDAISVRDRNSQKVIEELTGREAEIHLDPTLVYDLIGSEKRIPAKRQHHGNYIIVYGYSGRFTTDENAEIREYARNLGARVLAFGGLQGSADKFVDCDPFTLLAYFRDATAVVTDTFHGTIFSVINEVPFATIVRKSNGHEYGNEEKLGYLLERLGLSNRVLDAGKNLKELLDTPIDQVPVRATLQAERHRANEYLAEALTLISDGAV